MVLPKRGRVLDWLADLSDATRKQAQRALKGKLPGRNVRMGASGAPTSALDAAAEQVIIERLPDAPIPLNLATEEAGIIYNGADWWLVADPVDGTRNALRGLPIFGVSLALGRRDLSGIEVGLVQSIPSDDLFFAEKGKGATHNGRKLRTRKMDPAEVVLTCALDYEKKLQWPGGSNVHLRDLGSAALEMCWVASGALDGFYSTQMLLRVVDIAASTLIVREAGGLVDDLSRRPLNVPFDVRKKFPMVALGDPRVWEVFHR